MPTLSETDLDDYDKLLAVETIDIYNFISGKDLPPDDLKGTILQRSYTKITSW